MILVLSLLINVAFVAFLLYPKFIKSKVPIKVTQATNDNNLFDEINPVNGFEINVPYGKLGPKMISSGIIDLEKFKSTYQRSNQPLTPEQEEILSKGSLKKIKITRDNSYFLLNFFWAVGLANKSKILEEGEMIKYKGREGVGGFASTGGWTLAKSDTMKYYSKSTLVSLTKEQEDRVNQIAANIFRPCCNNSTAFPDCNHGMALLGVLQVLASDDATEKEMYQAGKYFNAFWFPGNYYDLALYFKNKESTAFKDIDAKLLLSREYSSASGWQNVKKWLIEKDLIQQPPKQSGSCGV